MEACRNIAGKSGNSAHPAQYAALLRPTLLDSKFTDEGDLVLVAWSR
jgi:hypothetical protein